MLRNSRQADTVNEPGQPLEGPKNMSRLRAPAPIVAIIYSEGREVDPVIATAAF